MGLGLGLGLGLRLGLRLGLGCRVAGLPGCRGCAGVRGDSLCAAL